MELEMVLILRACEEIGNEVRLGQHITGRLGGESRDRFFRTIRASVISKALPTDQPFARWSGGPRLGAGEANKSSAKEFLHTLSGSCPFETPPVVAPPQDKAAVAKDLSRRSSQSEISSQPFSPVNREGSQIG